VWIVELGDGGGANRTIRLDFADTISGGRVQRAKPSVGMRFEAYGQEWVVDRVNDESYVAHAVPAP
jgi:hypothetical protein